MCVCVGGGGGGYCNYIIIYRGTVEVVVFFLQK